MEIKESVHSTDISSHNEKILFFNAAKTIMILKFKKALEDLVLENKSN